MTEYSPQDIAIYLFHKALPIKKELDLLYAISNSDLQIEYSYVQNIPLFIRRVRSIMMEALCTPKEIEKLMSLLSEVGQVPEDGIDAYQESHIALFFKFIRLDLQFTDIRYTRFKTRSLLRAFHMKRRSPQLISMVEQLFQDLSLSLYQRGGRLCSFKDLKLDEWGTVRLEESNRATMNIYT